MALNLSLLNYVNDMTNLILVNVFFCISARVTSRARYHSANVSRLKTKTKKKGRKSQLCYENFVLYFVDRKLAKT